jgi:hypothetical protein
MDNRSASCIIAIVTDVVAQLIDCIVLARQRRWLSQLAS